MAFVNENYTKLQDSYLFSTVANKVAAFAGKNPDKKIIRLGIGDVTRPLAPAVVEAMQNAAREMGVKETFRGYGPEQGYDFLRSVIVDYYASYGVSLDTSEVFVSDGAKSDCGNITDIFANCNTILVPDPVYPVYLDTNIMCGRKVVFMNGTPENNFLPMPDENVDADVIYLCSPNNPTGALYPKELLLEIVEIARQKDLIIFADEIYDRLVMDGLEHTSIAALAPDLFVVTFNGLSKSHRVAGYRCGWMCLCGNKEHVKGYIEGINLLSSMRLCSNVPAQSIIQTSIGGYQSSDELLLPGGRIYEQREYVYQALSEIPGISVVKPKAAFYIFPKLDVERFHIFDDEQFALDFLREKRILITSGSAFNWGAPDHFRIVYLPNMELLHTSMERLADFMATYRQD